VNARTAPARDVGSEFTVRARGGLEPRFAPGDRVVVRVVAVADLLHRQDDCGQWHPPAVSPGAVVYVELADGRKRLKALRRASERAVTVGDLSPRAKHATDTAITVPTADVVLVALAVHRMPKASKR
jgi:hypothetical protein